MNAQVLNLFDVKGVLQSKQHWEEKTVLLGLNVLTPCVLKDSRCECEIILYFIKLKRALVCLGGKYLTITKTLGTVE